MTENGRITSEKTEIAPYLSQKTEYRYEERSAGGVYPDHRPVEVQNYYHDGTGYAAYPAYCYDYDELGRVVGEGMADRTEFSVQYQYKKRKKLVNGAVTDDTAETNYIEKMSYRRRGWNLGEETYTYDENGNITEIRDGDNISKFWYDGANRIVRELNENTEISYEYDEKGNIISTDAQYVNEDVRIPLAIQRYYYTATGGITGFEHSAIVHPGTGQTVFPICTEYNAGGYPLNYLGKEIIWDGSRMAQMGEVKYKYNAEGIRQEKEVNGRKHIYYTQGTKLLAEKITEEGQPDINKQYLYAGEKPIGFVLNGKPYQYLYNGLGNLVRVFDAKTGRIAAEYSYTAFGSCTVTNHTEENIGDQNPIRYKGYYYDEETGLYYLKSRYYSPAYRIFLSPDEPEYMDPSDFSGLNLYTYCYNNPIIRTQKIRSSTTPFIRSSSMGKKERVDQNVDSIDDSSSEFKIFGSEIRSSFGWDSSPNLYTGFWGRIGVSSYVTKTQGQNGIFYAFAGSTSDVMNWFGITYYAGIGMNLFNVFGIEFQFEAVGAGTQINLGPLNIGVNVNLIGGTSLTIGWNTDLGDGLTRTEGITIGINTGFLLATILWIFKFFTTGDPSLVPRT